MWGVFGTARAVLADEDLWRLAQLSPNNVNMLRDICDLQGLHLLIGSSFSYESMNLRNDLHFEGFRAYSVRALARSEVASKRPRFRDFPYYVRFRVSCSQIQSFRCKTYLLDRIERMTKSASWS